MKSSKERSNSSKEDEVLKLDWTKYISQIYELAAAVKRSKIKFDLLYAVPRGGNIPGTILSHELGIKMVDDLVPSEYKNKNLLLVDDVCDSGKVLTEYVGYVINSTTSIPPKNVKTAVLYKHEKADFIPDFFVGLNKNWVTFPFEKD